MKLNSIFLFFLFIYLYNYFGTINAVQLLSGAGSSFSELFFKECGMQYEMYTKNSVGVTFDALGSYEALNKYLPAMEQTELKRSQQCGKLQDIKWKINTNDLDRNKDENNLNVDLHFSKQDKSRLKLETLKTLETLNELTSEDDNEFIEDEDQISFLATEIYQESSNTQWIPALVGGVSLIYNLPNIQSIKLTRLALVRIVNGNITHWNDPLIQETNPSIPLPNLNISFIIRKGASGTNTILSTALSSFSSEWKHGIHSNFSEILQTENRTLYALDTNTHMLISCRFLSGCITYVPSSHSIHKISGLSVASIINRFGKAVIANTTTISSSLDTLKNTISHPNCNILFSNDNPINDISNKLNGLNGLNGVNGVNSLNCLKNGEKIEWNNILSFNANLSKIISDSSISNAYPIVGFTFITYSPTSNNIPCKEAKALYQYFLFLYTNEISTRILQNNFYAPLPALLISQVQEQWKNWKCGDIVIGSASSKYSTMNFVQSISLSIIIAILSLIL